VQDAQKVVVDGNDGTGKTTLVTALRELGIEVSDRGLPTKATDSSVPLTPVPGEVYVVLDCAPETSQ
jgi:energy-coupling factor transporter ATP-binding protein EcfA2